MNIKVCLLQKTISSKLTYCINGFFITGRNDHTTCFHRGVSLKDWEASDSVWQQHSKWSPKCICVVYKKGIELVLHNAKVLKTALNLQVLPVCNASVVYVCVCLHQCSGNSECSLWS